MTLEGIKLPEGLTPGHKIWLSLSGEGVFGHGKWRLIEAIDRTGSLQTAAAALEISYRKAWGDLRKTEKLLGFALVERCRGGRHGGYTRLTEAGKRFLDAYGRYESEMERYSRMAFEHWLERMNK